MSMSRYDTFLKVLELGSFSKAAQKLGYTQSTVSQSVSQMESEFGFKLLNRSRNGITLTAEGEEILPFIQEAVNCERKIEEKVSEINGILEGSINVGTYHTISYSWMPQIMKEFNSIYPGVNLKHVHGNSDILRDLLITGKVDCCLMDILPGDELDGYKLYREKYKVILPADHPDRDRDFFPLSRLEEEYVTYVKQGRGLVLFIEDEKYQVTENTGACYTTDENVLFSMVERGFGVGLVAELALDSNKFNVVVKDTDEPVYRDLGLVVKDRKKLSPSARAFIRHVIENDYYLDKNDPE